MPTPTTREGYEKLKSEIDHLENVEMPEIAKAIAAARSEGDLSENAEYHGQRERQGMVQAKINLLRTKLADSYIVDRDAQPKDKIGFGSRITLRDIATGDEERYELVGPGEEDYSGDVMKILCSSPMAQQLLNHKVGDKVTVDTPGGKLSFEVLALE